MVLKAILQIYEVRSVEFCIDICNLPSQGSSKQVLSCFASPHIQLERERPFHQSTPCYHHLDPVRHCQSLPTVPPVSAIPQGQYLLQAHGVPCLDRHCHCQWWCLVLILPLVHRIVLQVFRLPSC